ncbi:unnamed protein product [Blepharisma stoltei]|uniref:Uncharacterized protein n=1 Tax=Blepharisma stoltei TaxID=1481888 RepID=A0AAU9IPN1_9CILI|nr:unnamed protein product [Blepharisma stoltei]
MASVNKSMSALATLVFRMQNDPLGPKMIKTLEPIFIKHRRKMSHIDLSYIVKPYANNPWVSDEMKQAIIQSTIELKEKLEPFNIINIFPWVSKFENTQNLFVVFQEKMLSIDWTPKEIAILLSAYSKVNGSTFLWKNMERNILSLKNQLTSYEISDFLFSYTKKKIKTRLFDELRDIVMKIPFKSNDAVYTMHSYIKNEHYDVLIIDKLSREINLNEISLKEVCILYASVLNCLRYFNELPKAAKNTNIEEFTKNISNFTVEIETLIRKNLKIFHIIDLLSILEVVDKYSRPISIKSIAQSISSADQLKGDLSIKGFETVANILAKNNLPIPTPLIDIIFTLI